MKTIILCFGLVIAALFCALTAKEVYSTDAISDLQLENIEALGDGDKDNNWQCPGAALEYEEAQYTGDRKDGIYGKVISYSVPVHTTYNCDCKKIKYIEMKKYCN